MSDIQNGNNVLRQLLLLASSEALIGEWRLIARSVNAPKPSERLGQDALQHDRACAVQYH